ncbi:MAG: molybdate ABC transporter permease subunit [Heliobacteriaceae bacterium]|nr:molybdate ABC transporter permease subunit [Heliobacteriaceae bacterium]MDD4588269.1 molybdate ABC transporter permease subunit [Heliobacteriaceae bacterium]
MTNCLPGFDASPVWLSLQTAFTATIITFFWGIAAARWLVGYQGRGKSFIDGIFTLPLVLPPTVIGFGLLLLFGKNGPLGSLLLHLGASVVFSWPATVIAATVVAFPLMYQTARGAFEQIEANIENAARTLGASEWTIFWRVTLPLAWPGIAAGTVLAFSRALGEFGATLMLAGNIPGKTQTIPMAIYFAVDAGKTGQALAWVAVIVSISLGVIVTLNYWKRRQGDGGARLAAEGGIKSVAGRGQKILSRLYVGSQFFRR